MRQPGAEKSNVAQVIAEPTPASPGAQLAREATAPRPALRPRGPVRFGDSWGNQGILSERTVQILCIRAPPLLRKTTYLRLRPLFFAIHGFWGDSQAQQATY